PGGLEQVAGGLPPWSEGSSTLARASMAVMAALGLAPAAAASAGRHMIGDDPTGAWPGAIDAWVAFRQGRLEPALEAAAAVGSIVPPGHPPMALCNPVLV